MVPRTKKRKVVDEGRRRGVSREDHEKDAEMERLKEEMKLLKKELEMMKKVTF